MAYRTARRAGTGTLVWPVWFCCRFVRVDDGVAYFSGDVEGWLRGADDAAADYMKAVDEYALRSSLEAEDAYCETCSFSPRAVDRLDLSSLNVGTILWCTGYALDFDWVRLPILDSGGSVMQRRGVSSVRVFISWV